MSPPRKRSSRASTRLPPYVFNITAELKMAARRRGEDIIDFSMGNPDGPTPQHIVDKLVETVQRARHARLLGVEGHSAAAPRDLPLVQAALRRRVRSGHRGDRHHRLEGRPRAPGARDARPRRHGAGAQSELSDPHLRPGDRRRRHPPGADDAGRRFLRRARAARSAISYPEAEDADPQLSRRTRPRSASSCRSSRRSSRWRASTTSTSCTTSPTPTSCFDGWKAPSIMQVPGARDVAVEFFTMSKSYNMAGWRIGFMVGNRDLVHALARIKSYHDYGTFTPIQVAAIAALEGPQDCVAEIAREVPEAPRRAGARACTRPAGWSTCPKASMYVWAQIPEPYRDAGLARVRQEAAGGGEGRGVAGHRLRRLRRRPRALRADRERGPHAPGGARHQADVPRGWTALSAACMATASGAATRDETDASRPARHRHGRRRHVGRAAPQRGGDRAPRRPADPHHVDRRRARSIARARRRAAIAGVNLTDDAAMVVAHPGHRHRRRADRRHRAARARWCSRRSRNGKHVVTANKALLAQHGNEIFAAAQQEGRDGRVRGRGRRRHADHQGAARRPDRQPHRMDRRHHQRHLATSSCRRCATRARRSTTVLKEAQARGYAEADPTFDIEGIDAAHKLTIMSAIAFGVPMQFDKAYTEGISKLDARGHPLRRGARLPHQAARHHAAHDERHRAARASDADPDASG